MSGTMDDLERLPSEHVSDHVSSRLAGGPSDPATDHPGTAAPGAPAPSAPVTPPGERAAATALRRLLDLLATDAAVEEFPEPLAEARRRGASPAELAELDEAVRQALLVHRRLRQHRRREAELTALFDTATDLAASRDLDPVLRAIVRRARLLLGTDTAYLTLPDTAAGDTYMRVTDGSVSPLFQHLRLSLGDGLGGLVAQSARPYATADYRADQRFRHTGRIDAGVLEEGLVAILGVPLLLGDTVVGVLFAADRAPRAFTPDQVALLCSLAAHAAVALDTAKALADSRAALAELNAANTVIQAHAAAVQRAERAHDRLTELVLRGADVAQVADEVALLLGGEVTVHDAEGHPLAGRAGGARRAAEAVERARTEGRAVRHGDSWVCAVLAGPALLGSLVLRGRPELDDPDRRLFERAGVVTALLLLLRRSAAEAEHRVRGELLTDLLTAPGRDPAALLARGRRLGIDLTRRHLVLVAETAPDGRARLAGAAAQYLFGQRGGAGGGRGVSAEHGEAVVLLLPDDGATGPEAAARAAAERLARLAGQPVTVGAGPSAAGPPALAAAHAEALRCVRALRALGRGGQGAAAESLGFLGVLLADGPEVAGFVARTLGPLLAYDERRGTELVGTLRAYFACGGSLTRAKEELHVHVNTVVQRLERVAALLGPDWNEPARALELQLALRLRLLADGPFKETDGRFEQVDGPFEQVSDRAYSGEVGREHLGKEQR
ncbi:helix-turn-helix domain-containing protein [Kitasatospora sp. NBC_01287]|uniref:helix-turn-helix domain-containing protein n=1 Tax=Kitasatospora sp. NBC_01287 TaxID=2903573 RepID=UPI00224F605A|nr:helix-turn-helix domain-containing protein [Kitasatospora sp. NBC_01287]MCX4749510.1 helix-turn-helix domain-containing protein [Kitasatospora sp. NBC_01287]